MESTRDFFSKLRKMAVTLEAETEKLQQAFEGRKNEDGDSGERGSNKLCCSVLTPKHVQLQGELAEQKQREEEVRGFIEACRVMEQRVSKDIHTIRTHLEKYGYQAPSEKSINLPWQAFRCSKHPGGPSPAFEDETPPQSCSYRASASQINNLESPELPVVCTPGLKIKKPNGHLPSQETRDPESPCRHGNLSPTPEVPAFETPYVNRLVSAQHEPISLQGDGDSNIFKLQTSPCNGRSESKLARENDVPEVNFFGVEEKEIPEMPNLESFLGNSLQTDAGVSRPDLDGPTQEFSFGTPRIRMTYQEPSTPEMPDLSSVTQDICKVGVASFSFLTISLFLSSSAPPAKGLTLVSQSEFQTLPSYLRLMTLSNLNQAVQNINRFTAQRHGETKEFTMDDLRRIISVGTKAPVYILCLTELQRLKQVDGVLEAAVYKLITGN
uniref:Uncharacterized protein n=1 Tax=Xiphophorus couchianus TaxID=32473 RepID=A0A3B5ML16_9TELE